MLTSLQTMFGTCVVPSRLMLWGLGQVRHRNSRVMYSGLKKHLPDLSNQVDDHHFYYVKKNELIMMIISLKTAYLGILQLL